MKRPNARKVRRAELEATWNFWPAERPLTRHDLAAPPPPEAALAPAAQAEPSVLPDGGTTSDAVRLHLADGRTRTVRLDDPNEVARFTAATDAEIARLFGVTEMDVRESRKWAREQTERLGVVTVTGIDDDTGTVTVQ